MVQISGGSAETLEDGAGGLTAPAIHREGSLLLAWSGELEPRHLLRKFREQGADSLTSIRDPVALAIFDTGRKELLLAVDRFGIETLYFTSSPSGLVFGSTLPRLRSHPTVQLEVDDQSIFNYVFFHMVPSPRAVYRGLERLEPGECLTAKNGKVHRRRYWWPSYERRNDAEEELADEYRATMRRAVARCLARAPGKVGAFLSGGTDSSTLTGILGELSGEPPRTYSIGFDVPRYDESRFARLAVEHFGADHHEYVITPDDLREAVPELARAYDEPFGNASAVGAYYCARLARDDGVETMLAGDGGDEIFAGNARYGAQKVFERYFAIPAPLRKSLIEPLLDVFPENTTLLRKAKSYVRQANTPLPDRMESYNFLSRMEPRRVFSSDFLASVNAEEPLELLRRSYAEAPTSSTLNRLLYLDIKFTLADNDLRKVERTSEMAGVTVEYPFLDYELVDFANGVPPELKLKGRQLRYFFKRASRGFLPDEILRKKKHGFGVPCGRWMRDHESLRELAYDSLDCLCRRGYLQKSFTDELIGLHRGEHVDFYGVMVWILTMLELWLQSHVD